MTSEEKYLIENGWVTEDSGYYSSLGTVVKVYRKNGQGVVYGLGEPGRPPSFLAPLPSLKINGYLTIPDYNETQQLISKYGFEKVLKCGLNNLIMTL